MLKFLKEFIKNPRYIGAISPSSKYLAEKMLETLDFSTCNCIIEFGPGTGVFTEKILARKKDDTLLIVIEKNNEFYEELVQKYGNKKSVKIINDCAENIEKYLNKYNISKVDCIVSGLPFTALPKTVCDDILRATVKNLRKDGQFITFQYSTVKLNCFKQYFANIEKDKVLLNLPPAYVLKCSR